MDGIYESIVSTIDQDYQSKKDSEYSYSSLSSSKDIADFNRNMQIVFKSKNDMSKEKTHKSMKAIKFNGEIIGYIGFSRYNIDGKKYLGIGNFMIIPRYQSSGHGTKIIKDLIDRYKDTYDEIYCYVEKENTKAIQFYKRIADVNTKNLTKYGYYVCLYRKGASSTNESYIEESSKYDRPYSADEIKKKYGIDVYDKLVQDPVHKYRMDSGIELIHKEPSKDELERIWKNWNRMTTSQKRESDKKSIELFGKTNKDHYNELISSYDESYLLQEASSNKVYHLSQTNLDGKTIQPTVPSDYMTVNGYEDGKTKRVCFATSIDGCLRGLSLKCEGMKLFVHVPDDNYNIYKPSNKEVPDASITGEVWIKKAVKMKCIGQIYVIGDKGEDGIPYKYGDKTAELYDWEWKWIDKFNESSSILPQNTEITTVIFDLGDVLVSANIKDYLVADPEVPNEIVDELFKHWFIDKDEVDDTMDLDTYREIVNKRMGVEFSKYIPKLFQYNVDCVNAFDYTIPIIQDLKDKGYKVYYLSNWPAWTHDLLQEAGKFDFLKLMDGGVFSYDVGYMKPDEEIYKILINKYKINPEEAVFFDDREENIEAANKLGIHGVHFPRHDSSIVYNNLYGRKLAKAIYE